MRKASSGKDHSAEVSKLKVENVPKTTTDLQIPLFLPKYPRFEASCAIQLKTTT
jgi:hypothetical protein